MGKTEQKWQESGGYRAVLGRLELSQEAKRRLVRAILDPPQQAVPRRRRPVGALAAAGLACAVLTTVAAAAALNWRNPVRFVDSPEEAAQLAEQSGTDGNAVAVGSYDGDWEYSFPTEEVAAWWGDYAAAGAVETAGAARDGWTHRRTIREGAGSRSMYLGNSLEDFAGLWRGQAWNVEWIETRYTPVEGAFSADTRDRFGNRERFSLLGAYQNEDGGAFTLQYSWDAELEYSGTYMLSGGYDYTEFYDTADGVEGVISMATSDAGSPVFWADFDSGRQSFGMVGTGLELEEIREILDSLGLAAALQGK